MGGGGGYSPMGGGGGYSPMGGGGGYSQMGGGGGGGGGYMAMMKGSMPVPQLRREWAARPKWGYSGLRALLKSTNHAATVCTIQSGIAGF